MIYFILFIFLITIRILSIIIVIFIRILTLINSNEINKMLENDTYNQMLSPNISILITNESNDANKGTLKQEKPKIFQNFEPFLVTKHNNSNNRKCLSRLNLNEIKSDIKILQPNTKQYDSSLKLKKKSMYQLNTSSFYLNNDLRNQSSLCLDSKNKNLLPNFDSKSKFLQLNVSNANLFKSSNSLNALDLEIIDTFSIGSFDRYSLCSLYSINDLDRSDFARLNNSFEINRRSMHLDANTSQPMDKVKNWLEKI